MFHRLVAALFALAVTSVARGNDFTTIGPYGSVEGFAKQARAFQPLRTPGYMAGRFSMLDSDTANEAKLGRIVVPEKIAAVNITWQGESEAVVFATANPPLESTRAEVGVLFLLTRGKDKWHVIEYERFETFGKYAKVECDLTAGVGTGHRLGTEGNDVVLTIRRTNGGRGYTYFVSRSYRVAHPAGETPRFEESF